MNTAPPTSARETKIWLTAEDHRFALEVLQLRLRREILKFVGIRARARRQIEEEFDLSTFQADYHLSMLEKALVVERVEGCIRITPTGILYLEKVEARR
jgi:predicted transcriptional regulator